MSAKIEFIGAWFFGLIAFITKHDLLIYAAIGYNLLAGIKSIPGACKTIKQLKNDIYARMVKKTNEN
jgi:hypothetical protein